MPAVANVAIGKPRVGGAIFRAPAGTALPTDASTALASAFVEQGYVSDEGVSRAITKSFASKKAWGGDEVASTKTEETVRVTFALIEANNPSSLRAKYGEGAVTVTDGLTAIAYAGAETDAGVWVIDMEYNGVLRRLVFGNAKDVTEDFTQTYADEELIELPFELAVTKDATGLFFHEYIEAS